MLYLAIDQHRKQLTVNLRNEQGDVLVKRQVSTEWPRVRGFREEVRTMSVPEGGFVAILEICGFNDWLLKLLTEYGCREGVAQSDQATARVEDRAGGGDASFGDDHLAHGKTQRALRGRRSAAAKAVGPGSMRLYDTEHGYVLGGVGFSEAW